MTTILLIDDDPAVRETLADFLDTKSYHVEQAENGHQALKALEHQDFDLIVLDVFMPDMGGMDLIKILSEKHNIPPIITISGGGGILPPKWSLKITEVYGVEFALTKPIDMNDFLATVERALKSPPLA